MKDTNDEVRAWAETAEWKRDVLSQPWVLSKAQRDKIDQEIVQDAVRERETAKKRKLRVAKYVEKKRRHIEKTEKRRKREEEELNAGALKGSNVLPGRVTDS